MDGREGIHKLFEAYKASVYGKDAAGLASIYDEDVLVFDMWSAYAEAGKGELRKSIAAWFGGLGTEKVVVAFEDVRVRQEAGLAFASAFVRYEAVAEDGRTLRSMKNRLTWNAVKKDGAWLIVHQHTSIPIDAATMAGKFEA